MLMYESFWICGSDGTQHHEPRATRPRVLSSRRSPAAYRDGERVGDGGHADGLGLGVVQEDLELARRLAAQHRRAHATQRPVLRALLVAAHTRTHTHAMVIDGHRSANDRRQTYYMKRSMGAWYSSAGASALPPPAAAGDAGEAPGGGPGGGLAVALGAPSTLGMPAPAPPPRDGSDLLWSPKRLPRLVLRGRETCQRASESGAWQLARGTQGWRGTCLRRRRRRRWGRASTWRRYGAPRGTRGARQREQEAKKRRRAGGGSPPCCNAGAPLISREIDIYWFMYIIILEIRGVLHAW